MSEYEGRERSRSRDRDGGDGFDEDRRPSSDAPRGDQDAPQQPEANPGTNLYITNLSFQVR